ncbi:MAG: inositol monophosphatase [Salinivirgaceae bacterium]|nr:inositol monophosphatase [Salinivirgaceae bacterium]
MIDIERIEPQTIELVKEVGRFIREQRAQFDSSKIEHKGLHDYVSYVDKGSERQLVDGLSKILPGSGFIVEENTAGHSTEENIWIIDPLDGTTNFLHNVYPFAISVALQHKGELVLGIVYELGRNELFHSAGKGAFCNGQPISASAAPDLEQSLIVTGFPISKYGRLDGHVATVKEIVLHSQGIRRTGSAASDLAYVACGRFDGYFEYGLNPWDVAGGAFIAQQAGALVSDYRGGSNYLFGGEILAASKNVYPRLLEILQREM